MKWIELKEQAAPIVEPINPGLAKLIRNVTASQTAIPYALRALRVTGRRTRFDNMKVSVSDWNILVDFYAACLEDELEMARYMKKG